MRNSRRQRPRSRLAQAVELSRTLRDLGREIARYERDVAAPLDLSAVQSQALRAAAEAGPAGMNDLAERLCIAPSTATRLVDQLETRGWVTRVADPDDRRRSVVQLTASGAELADQLHAESVHALWDRLHRSTDVDAALSAVDELLQVLRDRD